MHVSNPAGYPQDVPVAEGLQPGGDGDPIAGFAFWLRREREVANRTAEAYLYWLDRYRIWCQENGISLLNARPLDVRTFSTSGDWARKTRSQLLSSLKSFYSYCELEEMVLRSPARSVPHPRLFQQIQPRYDQSQARLLLAGRDDPTDQMMVGLGLYGGLRPGEALGLEPRDIDFRASMIRIQRTLGEPTTKGRRSRQIPMHTYLRDPLRIAVRVASPRLFSIETPQGYRDRLAHLCERRQVPYYGAQGLRRTFAMRLAQLKVREGVIRALLGHALRTEDLYMDVTSLELKQAIRALSY